MGGQTRALVEGKWFLIFPGWLCPRFIWDGVKWGIAGRGSDSSPFRFLGLGFRSPGLQTRGFLLIGAKTPASEEAGYNKCAPQCDRPIEKDACGLLAAAGRPAAILTFVAGAVGRHEHAAFGAGWRAVEHGAHSCVLGRQIVGDRSEQHMRHGWWR